MHRPRTKDPAALVEAWRRFVDEVERGYPLGLDDYCNDLDLRSLIEEAGVASQVAEADARLRKLLIHTELAIWSSDTPDAFWVRGYSANAGGELLADLKGRGPI
jgi:hypothetical protein